MSFETTVRLLGWLSGGTTLAGTDKDEASVRPSELFPDESSVPHPRRTEFGGHRRHHHRYEDLLQ